MKVELIGTGSATAKSNGACSIINGHILLDVANGSCRALKAAKYDIMNLDACIITHFHGDHFFDNPFLLLLKRVQKREQPFIIAGPKGVGEKVIALTQIAYANFWNEIEENLNFKFIEYEERKLFSVFELSVEPILVNHLDLKDAYGCVIQEKEQILGFTGDTCLCEGVKEITQKSNRIVIETTLENGNDEHMGINNVQELARNYPDKIFTTSHMKDATKKILLEKQDLEPNIVIGQDGYRFLV